MSGDHARSLPRERCPTPPYDFLSGLPGIAPPAKPADFVSTLQKIYSPVAIDRLQGDLFRLGNYTVDTVSPRLQVSTAINVTTAGSMGLLPLTIVFPQDYPGEAPQLRFLRILPNQPHVDYNGTITLPYLREWSASTHTLTEAIRLLSTPSGGGYGGGASSSSGMIQF